MAGTASRVKRRLDNLGSESRLGLLAVIRFVSDFALPVDGTGGGDVDSALRGSYSA